LQCTAILVKIGLSVALVLGGIWSSNLAVAGTVDPPSREVAIGVNVPLDWLAGAIAASGYWQLADQHALRVNVATFPEPHYLASGLVIAATQGDGGGAAGRCTDVGAGWDWYPSGFLHGFGTEVGAFYRTRNNHDYYDGLGQSFAYDTQLVAARATIGWTWRGESLFASVATGASLGYERGTRRVYDPGSTSMPTSAVHQAVPDLEAYFRIGYVFGR